MNAGIVTDIVAAFVALVGFTASRRARSARGGVSSPRLVQVRCAWAAVGPWIRLEVRPGSAAGHSTLAVRMGIGRGCAQTVAVVGMKAMDAMKAAMKAAMDAKPD